MDKATVFPVTGAFDSFFATLSESDMKGILQCIRICKTRSKQSAEDPYAVKLASKHKTTAYVPATVNVEMSATDNVRKFQMDLYNEIEKHANANLFVLEYDDASQTFPICLASLMCVLAGQGRHVILEIVDKNYSPICGWSYRQIWRKWAAEQKKMSPLMVMGAAKYMKSLAATLSPLREFFFCLRYGIMLSKDSVTYIKTNQDGQHINWFHRLCFTHHCLH